MRNSINIDHYSAPPRGVADIRGTVILYTEDGEVFSGCKKNTVTGYAHCEKQSDKKTVSPSTARIANTLGFPNGGKGRGLKHFWHVVNERGERGVIRWDKLLKYRNRGELEIVTQRGGE